MAKNLPASGSPEEAEIAYKRANKYLNSPMAGRYRTLTNVDKGRQVLLKQPEVPGVSSPKPRSANAAVNAAVPNKRGPMSGATRGALGLPAQSGRSAQTTRPTSPPKRSTPSVSAKPAARPAASPTVRKTQPAPTKPMVTNAAAPSVPKTNPPPAPKQSWWDKFSADHKLSADKSYNDYKKLMGD